MKDGTSLKCTGCVKKNKIKTIVFKILLDNIIMQ